MSAYDLEVSISRTGNRINEIEAKIFLLNEERTELLARCEELDSQLDDLWRAEQENDND
jgi:hypothetical protein